MTLWNWIKDYAPPYAEEIILKTDTEQIQETLSQFEQLVPEGFQKLEPAKKNNWGSTEGLDKVLCERYLFTREDNKPIWLDIPHELMEELKLPIGKNCPWPFYLKSEVLESEREEVEGAITIGNEEEIFLKKPFAVENLKEDISELLEKIESQKEKNNQLTTQLEELQQVIDKWKNRFATETERLNRKMVEVQKTLQAEKEQLNNEWQDRYQQEQNQKDNEITRLENEVRKIENELNQVKQKLQKEKGWWDKWASDSKNQMFPFDRTSLLEGNQVYLLEKRDDVVCLSPLAPSFARSAQVEIARIDNRSYFTSFLYIIKTIHDYYLNK